MRKIYTPENFLYDKACIGDLVSEPVINEVIGVLPPVYLTRDCVQMGEPVATRKSEDGTWRFVYYTFKRVDKEVWEYRGCCFEGETTPKE
jgi:hypothetical protein